MASNIDLFLDAGGLGLQSRGSGGAGTIPTLTRNDVYTFRLRIQSANIGQTPSDIDLTGASLKLGIGNIDDPPNEGAYKLIINGVTSGEISYNATTTQIKNAVSANVATVSAYGSEELAFVLTATQPNNALVVSGDPFTLFPASSIVVGERRAAATGVNAQAIIKLRRNPAVFANNFTLAPTAGMASITKTQDGATTANESYRLAFSKDAEGGSFVLNYGANSTTAIAIGATAVCAAEALGAVTGIGAGNISVSDLLGEAGYSISFVRQLGNQNITTALTLDSSGIYFAPFRQATVTMATAELDELFADENADTISPVLEIELMQSGNPKTLYQNNVTIRKDLITSGANVPASKDTYYTKAESDALFVEDSTANVDATNRRLKNSSGTTIVDYQNGYFGASSIVNLSASQVTIGNFPSYLGSTVTVAGAVSLGDSLAIAGNVGFYGTIPIAKPSGANVISNVVSLGLIQSSATYGILPLSQRTLTTTASINFGLVSSNDTVTASLTITGAATNDIVLLGLPSAVCPGLIFYGHVVSTNTVEIDVVNGTNQSKTQSGQTYRLTVIGY